MEQAPEQPVLGNRDRKETRLNSDGHILNGAENRVHQTPFGQAQLLQWELPTAL